MSMSASIWERFPNDPRQPEHAPLRASDRDRDVVNDVLGTAYAEGRLTPEELDERGDLVVQAKTLGELPPIIRDLVATSAAIVRDKRAEAERRYLSQRQQALWRFLTPTLICWVVYAVTMSGGFPWPAIVTIATGMQFLRVATGREAATSSIERDLAKKERKRLEERQRKGSRALPPSSGERPDSPDDPQVNQG